MLSSIVFATVLSTAVQAHFQLQYPIPRGPFVQDSEPSFCGQPEIIYILFVDAHRIVDGYNDAVDNRTVFPLSNGIININSEHPLWTGTSKEIALFQNKNKNKTFIVQRES
jgi:hypothetical protein